MPIHEFHELIKISVASMSVIYPLDRLGRNLLFETFDEFFNKGMHKSNNFFNNGNFKATHHENS